MYADWLIGVFFLGGIVLGIMGMWPGLLVGVGIAVYMTRANRYYRRDHKDNPFIC
jgi:ABC-type lipoprotein release transport system permease subunit